MSDRTFTGIVRVSIRETSTYDGRDPQRRIDRACRDHSARKSEVPALRVFEFMITGILT